MDGESCGRSDLNPGNLTCRACGRTIDCPPDALLRFMRTRDWPRCCGEIMCYYIPAGKSWEPKESPALRASVPWPSRREAG